MSQCYNKNGKNIRKNSIGKIDGRRHAARIRQHFQKRGRSEGAVSTQDSFYCSDLHVKIPRATLTWLDDLDFLYAFL